MVYPRALFWDHCYLFYLIINDLPFEDGLDLVSLFADDATKSTASKDVKNVVKSVQEKILTVSCSGVVSTAWYLVLTKQKLW